MAIEQTTECVYDSLPLPFAVAVCYFKSYVEKKKEEESWNSHGEHLETVVEQGKENFNREI